ncbi:hypothetical protein [Nocardioides solisilvae]|uniref:hypothetical protein n=1 Tax=Nocardioides solisilvae TaxID=1542435 RepID=UPI000D74B3B8|nr:hypothetical protein [Nocardioides solisilvae]
MNTLDDLRSTLHTHAREAGADRSALATRAGAARDRARATRRRRTAGAAAGAFVAAAALLGPALLPDGSGPGPAGGDVPAELAGHAVPLTLESTGWTYEYAGSVTGDDVVELDLEPSDEPRVIAWGNEATPPPGELDAWKVVVPGGGPVFAPTAADFTEFWRVPADVDGTFRFHGPGASALAVYELADERPPGTTVEGMTFRATVAGDRLVAADAVRGASTLPLRLTVPEGTLRFGAFCSGYDAEVELEVSLDGEVVNSGSSCERRTPFDPGTSWFASFPEGLATDAGPLEPGDVVDVEVRMRDADGDPVDPDDDVLLAASFYEIAEPSRTRLGRQPVPELVEVDGVTWALTTTQAGYSGQGTVRGTPVTEPSMAQVFVSGLPRGGIAKVSVDGEAASRLQGGEGSLGALFVPTGGRVDLAFEGTGPMPGLSWGVATYTRVD